MCTRSPVQLMLPSALRNVRRWVQHAVADLDRINASVPAAADARRRPPVVVVGQAELHHWARGIVWDFTGERCACACPLDFSLPIDTHLARPSLHAQPPLLARR